MNSPSSRVLVADDDADLLALLAFSLRNAGFETVQVRDGLSAVQRFAEQSFALVLLDLNMPGMDGFAVCAALRAQGSTPIVILSARDQEADVVRALDLGADGFLTKPFSPRSLIARLKAILRRSATLDPPRLEVAGVVLDIEAHALRAGALEIHLTRLETRVLQLLMASEGRTVSGERLLLDAWGRGGADERHALKQVIYRLRRKLEAEPPLAGTLQTLRSAGYRWRALRGASAAPTPGVTTAPHT